MTFSPPPRSLLRWLLAFACIALAPVSQAYVFDSFGDGYWTVVNQNNGKALVSTGTSSSQATTNGGDFAQQFSILYNLADGSFRLRNRDTLKCIGSINGATAMGTAVVEINYTGATHQKWNLVDLGGGYWQIINKAANLALQTDAGNPANVTLQALNSGNNLQRWQLNYQTHYPKKGGAGWDDRWGQFNVSWGYNWGANTGVGLPDSRVFEPMKYGKWWPGTNELGGGYAAFQSTAKPVYVMGFNEPDQASQGDTTVAQAIGLWPELQNLNVPLVSPAATNAYNGWLGDFYNQVAANGYRVDFTAVHWYANPNVDSLINHLQSVYNTWGRPVWLTEFGCVDWANNQAWSEEDDWRFLAEFVWRAEDLVWLKRYSMFVFTGDPPANPWSRVGARSNLYAGDNSTLTAVGELYASWDGDRSVTPGVAYMLQNQQSMFRMAASTANSPFPGGQPQYPSPVSIRFSGAQTQWTLQNSPTNGRYYITSLLDGRRLHTTGAGIDLAAAGTTGATVEWSIGSAGNGYFYIDNPAASVALYSTRVNNGDGSPSTVYYGVTPSGSPSDNTRFRLVKPYAAVAVPGAAVIPVNVAAVPGDRSVSLSWTGEGASFSVHRATTSGGPYTLLAANILTRNFKDNSALNDTTYYYVVTATTTLGDTSGFSAQASATPLATLGTAALMANYKFEGDVRDRSGQLQDGALGGGLTFVQPGKVDLSNATFNGADAYVQIPTVVANDFTIAFWMRTTATGVAGTQWYSGNGLIDGEMPGVTADFGISLLGNKVAFGVGNPDTTIQSTSAANDGGWHHVAVTRNGSTGTIQLYFDGTLQASATGPTGTRTAPKTLRIGSILTASRYFTGSLDEIRMYNYTVSQGDVTRLYQPRNAPVAVYRFEGSAQDSGGHGNQGMVSSGLGYAAGKIGAQSATFNGSGNSVIIPCSVVNDFSIACWMKTTATGGAGQWWGGLGIVDGEIGGAVADFGTSLVGNKLAFGVGNPDLTITSTTVVNDGQWHHFTATRNGTSGVMKLYVDGVLQATATGPIGPRTAPPSLRIGGLQGGYSYFSGSLDEVQLFGYPLSAGQALALANPDISPWINVDIGAPAADGFAGRDLTGKWSIGGSGADIWLASDQFQSVYQPKNGNGGIVTRITSGPDNTDGTVNANAKAGIMFRTSTAANSAFVDLVISRGQGLQFISRATAGANAAQTGPNVAIAYPFWLRLTRGGNVFQASYSTLATPGAADWVSMGSATVALPADTLAGLVVSSHNNGVVSEAGFEGAQVVANTPPSISTVAGQSISENTATAVLPVTVGDLETPATGLLLTATSSNPGLLPNGNILLGGAAASRSVKVTPVSNQSGAATITLTVSDGSSTTNSSFTVTVQTTPAGSWRQQWFGTTAATGNGADAADPDNDGVSNLWERAFNLNPTGADPAGVWPSMTVEGANLKLTYRRNLAASDLSYQVVWGSDLQGWSAAGVSDNFISTSGNTETRAALVAKAPGPSKFLRLRVTQP